MICTAVGLWQEDGEAIAAGQCCVQGFKTAEGSQLAMFGSVCCCKRRFAARVGLLQRVDISDEQAKARQRGQGRRSSGTAMASAWHRVLGHGRRCCDRRNRGAGVARWCLGISVGSDVAKVLFNSSGERRQGRSVGDGGKEVSQPMGGDRGVASGIVARRCRDRWAEVTQVVGAMVSGLRRSGEL
ncbi:hypothetical protein ACJRO7_027668 [Eucalyptus globulus]|uniref:Uncharacterized protein n=1 Tax=Eucalyptus globulus TaxID=34317 RepID=A0ABD3JWL7_EUCGL